MALAERFGISSQDVLDTLDKLDEGQVFSSNKSAILTRCVISRLPPAISDAGGGSARINSGGICGRERGDLTAPVRSKTHVQDCMPPYS